MKCILMHKNTPVMCLEYDTQSYMFQKIYEMYHIEYAPLAIYHAFFNKSQNILKAMNAWFTGRGIPSWRKDIEKLLDALQISSTKELLNKAYALSLSDQYWVKRENEIIEWKDINFFTNDFLYEAYFNVALDSSSREYRLKPEALKSPNNTTDGMIQKAWIIEDHKRVLVKGTYTPSQEEPFNEWLASQICKRLSFSYCPYTIDWLPTNQIVSKCANFLSDNEELISAYDIYMSEKKENHINDYTHYVSILEKHHVKNARIDTENMFILDYLVMNMDCHMKNFGIIRDVNSLEWKRVAPIFDSGESMQCDKYVYDMQFNSGTGKFFTDLNKDYERILDTIHFDLSRIDVDALQGLVEEYRFILEKYKDRLEKSQTRIDTLCAGLQTRIQLLDKYIREKQ